MPYNSKKQYEREQQQCEQQNSYVLSEKEIKCPSIRKGCTCMKVRPCQGTCYAG